jgi:hypothetical protein
MRSAAFSPSQNIARARLVGRRHGPKQETAEVDADGGLIGYAGPELPHCGSPIRGCTFAVKLAKCSVLA